MEFANPLLQNAYDQIRDIVNGLDDYEKTASAEYLEFLKANRDELENDIEIMERYVAQESVGA